MKTGELQARLDNGEYFYLSIEDAEAQAKMYHRIRQDLQKSGELLWKRLLGC